METLSSFEVSAQLLEQSHHGTLISMLELDNNPDTGRVFMDLPTPEATIAKLSENSCIAWSILADSEIAGCFSVDFRNDDVFTGFFTKTYVTCSLRNLGINTVIKTQLVDIFTKLNLPLYSKISENNECSLHATLRMTRNNPTSYLGSFRGYHVFRLVDADPPSQEKLPEIFQHIARSKFPSVVLSAPEHVFTGEIGII